MASKQDLSSFMAILIMTIGCLVILLVVNTLIIISNPENVEIESLVKAAYEMYSEDEQYKGAMGVPLFGNKSKQPVYVDVEQDRLTIYPEGKVVTVNELETPGNPFELLIQDVSENSKSQYIILILRPRSSKLGKQLRTMVLDQGIDIGQELYEAGRRIVL